MVEKTSLSIGEGRSQRTLHELVLISYLLKECLHTGRTNTRLLTPYRGEPLICSGVTSSEVSKNTFFVIAQTLPIPFFSFIR